VEGGAAKPFKQRPSNAEGSSALLADLASLGPSLILAPTLNRTWLEIAVASHFKGVRSVVLGGADVDPIFAASLRLDLGVDPAKRSRRPWPRSRPWATSRTSTDLRKASSGRCFRGRCPSVEVPKETASKAVSSAAAQLGLSREMGCRLCRRNCKRGRQVMARRTLCRGRRLARDQEGSFRSLSWPTQDEAAAVEDRRPRLRPVRGPRKSGSARTASFPSSRRSSARLSSTSGTTPAPCTSREPSDARWSASLAGATGPASGPRQGRPSPSSSPCPASAATGTAISATDPA
jgi:hypothetical protein